MMMLIAPADLAAEGLLGNVVARHRDHHSIRLMASRGVVRVNGRHRAVVAGVHGLQHVERFGATTLADDYAIRTHTQTVFDQIAGIHFALAFDIHGACFESHHVRLLQLQFGRVFDGDDAPRQSARSGLGS